MPFTTRSWFSSGTARDRPALLLELRLHGRTVTHDPRFRAIHRVFLLLGANHLRATGHYRKRTPEDLSLEGRIVTQPRSGGVTITYVRAVTGTAAPVTPEALSLVRNRITAATSAGDAHVVGSTLGMRARFTGWSMVAGRMTFAVMPSPLTSAASDSVHRTSAPFAIA